jgi:hypothetical protein
MSINPILVIISVWSGVIIFFSAVVAPTVFKSLEEKEAGVFLRAFFPKYYNFGILLGIAGLIYIFFMGDMDSLLLGSYCVYDNSYNLRKANDPSD